jgi:prepilin signal peptidase PulO-like enzyme (type II secretory pathway)
MLVASVAFVALLTLATSGHGIRTVQFLATAGVLAVIVFADLRTNKGRALVAEAFWLGLLALNIGHDSRDALDLMLDLVELLAGTAVIVWLLRRSETRRRRLRAHSPLS